jgi:hypothetical protein
MPDAHADAEAEREPLFAGHAPSAVDEVGEEAAGGSGDEVEEPKDPVRRRSGFAGLSRSERTRYSSRQ